MRRSSFLFVVTSALVVAACTPVIPEGRLLCAADSDCPGSFVCDVATSRCVSVVHAGDASIDAHVDSDGSILCEVGYASNGTTCVDVDECQTFGTCGVGGTCTNATPGFSCVCGPGYEHPTGLLTCADRNECSASEDDCGWNAHCSNVAGSFECACDAGFTPTANHTCVSSCAPAADTDTNSRTLTFGSMGLPTGAGFDIDGLNNAPRPNGVGNTVAGCGKVDLGGGVDASFNALAEALDTTIDLMTAVHDATATAGFMRSLTISKLGSATTGSDACVQVSLTLGGSTVAGVGAITSGNGVHVLTAELSSELVLSLPLEPPAAACNGGACNPGSLVLRVRAPRLIAVLDETNTTLTSATLGGFLFNDDADASFDPYDATSLQTAAANWGTATGLSTNILMIFRNGLTTYRDLRMTSNGLLEVCTGASTNAVNSNALSVAFDLVP